MERGPSLVTAFQTGRGIQWQTLCCRVETGPHFVLQYGRAGLAHPLTSISLPKYEIMVSLSLECFLRGWCGWSSQCDDLLPVSPTCSHCQGSALHHWTNTGSNQIKKIKGLSHPLNFKSCRQLLVCHTCLTSSLCCLEQMWKLSLLPKS